MDQLPYAGRTGRWWNAKNRLSLRGGDNNNIHTPARVKNKLLSKNKNFMLK